MKQTVPECGVRIRCFWRSVTRGIVRAGRVGDRGAARWGSERVGGALRAWGDRVGWSDAR